MSYTPNTPFVTALILLIPTYETVSGVPKATYPMLSKGRPFNGSFKTFGGTEQNVNGLLSVVDTAVIDTWYRPDIKSDCRIVDAETGQLYEILGTPEDIDKRHQFMRFKVKAVKGNP